MRAALARLLLCCALAQPSRSLPSMRAARPIAPQPDPDAAAKVEEPCLLASEVPPPAKSCKKRDFPLIILAGEGKTGTESLVTALAMLGLKVAHFDSLVQCCEVEIANLTAGYYNILGYPTQIPLQGAAPYCITTERGSGQTCQTVSWDSFYQPYVELRNQLYQMPLHEYDSYDWCVFDDYDVIADVPMPSFTPYIYNAYGKGTKVIQTTRNVTEWAERRARWDIEKRLNDSAPLGWMFSNSYHAAQDMHSGASAIGMWNRSHTAEEYAYIAERSLIRCTVEPEDYLELDIIRLADHPPTAWKLVSDFVGIPTGVIDTGLFPHEIPGTCHSENVLATYTLHDTGKYIDPALTTSAGPRAVGVPKSDATYQSFAYYPPELSFIQAHLGCASSTVHGPRSDPLGYPWLNIIEDLRKNPSLASSLADTPARNFSRELGPTLNESLTNIEGNMSVAFPGGESSIYNKQGKDILAVARLFHEPYKFNVTMGPGDIHFDLDNPARGVLMTQESVAEMSRSRLPRPLTGPLT